MFTDYYHLTKPGIIRGNALTVVAGFLLASHGSISLKRLVAILFGSSFIIAAACVCNNYIDRDIDQKMTRTKNRVLVSGQISGKAALLFAIILLAGGVSILLIYTNVLTFMIGLIGFVAYVAIYTPAKRRTVYSTLIGTISGALPPVAGYTTVTNRLDLACVLLFLSLVSWQMAHFYAIGIYRLRDYSAAGLPILPVQRGWQATQQQIVGYILLFIVATAALTVAGYTGYIYLVVMTGLSMYWLQVALRGARTTNETVWARRVFVASLIIMSSFSILLSLDSILV